MKPNSILYVIVFSQLSSQVVANAMTVGDPAPSDEISESRNQRMMECLARLVSCANTGVVRGPTRQGKKRDVRVLVKAGWSVKTWSPRNGVDMLRV
ncbi:hypothetical protein F5882DRAFT_420666 [Hyaloscypha sp. PMI_1271]|nr:hypothetical protein F5882DRAFT_420666 [Hyaloscypha sp. PMI_1271]